jgi:crotonobetaine/carnitine-CoA ligase
MFSQYENLTDSTDVPVSELVVRDVLARRAATHADQPFVRFGDEIASYGRVHENAFRIASALRELGVEKSELVALMLPNSIEYVELYFGAAYRGAAVMLVNTAFRGYMLEYVLNDAGCRILIADEQFLPLIAQSENGLQHLQLVLVPGEPASVAEWRHRLSRIKVIALGSLPADTGAAAFETDVDHRDLHCVVYSSGTTGPSKGIMISNAHSLVKAMEVLRICGFTANDVLYSPLPLFYSMGLLRGVLSVALVGSSIAIRDKFSVSSFWDDVRACGASVAHCVFSIPRMLQQVPPTSRDREHSLRCMFNAQFNAEFESRFGVKLIESYGLTEAGNAIYNRFDEPVVPGSCGRVSDEWEVRLGDRDGNEVPLGDAGEILLRPRQPDRLMLGYLNKSEVTVATFRDLWFHTGDLARMDANGFYFYQGRNKDVIRRRGQNISAWEVEQILLSHPEVSEAVALAQPSEVGEDDLRVVLIARDRVAALDLESIAAFCVDRMPAFMVPRFYEEVDELPKTASGRVEKYKLEGTLSEGHFDRGSGGRR